MTSSFSTASSGIEPRDRLIVALDVQSTDAARALVAQLGDTVSFYKIGMELAYGGGLPLAAELIAAGKKVFLDLKLHDIPNTVASATAQVAKLGATFLTIHAYPQTMTAARSATGNSGLRLLAVTVLTSSDDSDLQQAGYALGVRELVGKRAGQAKDAGIDGIVLSAEEAGAMRERLGPDMVLVTPGIRPTGADIGDQKRVMTPARAITEGATYLVVGRPVTQAVDPRATAAAIVTEIMTALKG